MKHKKHIKQHVLNLIAKTGFKKFYIAKQIGLKPEQLSQVLNCHRNKTEHREAIFCFLKYHVPGEIKHYKDVWLEDRPGTVNFKNAA